MNKGEQTRQMILSKAAPLFNQRGFAGCSMQDVLDATGLEKGGLYRHFPTKQNLATESFRYAREQAVRTRTAHLEGARNAVDQLRLAIQHFITAPSSVPGGCILMNTAIDADDTNPELRELARAGLEEWKQRLTDIVQHGIERRQIRKSTQPATIANVIVATLEGALMLSRLENVRTPLDDAAAALNTIFDSIAKH